MSAQCLNFAGAGMWSPLQPKTLVGLPGGSMSSVEVPVSMWVSLTARSPTQVWGTLTDRSRTTITPESVTTMSWDTPAGLLSGIASFSASVAHDT